jgi:ABC-type multidrug transport system ATPase subunit/ribosomal 50S subunit-associated protein YjgA (DUF615 family)
MSEEAKITPFQAILAWSEREQCRAWHSDALRRVISNGKLTDTDLDELVALARRENGATDVELAPEPLTAGHIPSNPKDDKSVALLCLRDTTGVNQLAASQKLFFEPTGITIVYGDNGAGKSGYARILKRACRARARGKIIPDAFDDNAPTGPATAAFDLQQGGANATPISWTDGPEPNATLSAVSVFDRQSGNVHLTGKNDVAFRPYGLDVPDELADAFGTIKNLLSAEQGELHRHRHATFLTPPWSPLTKVGLILNSIKADTDIDELAKFAVVSDAEKKRHAQLLKDLSHDPAAAAAEKRVFVEGLERFATTLQSVHQGASDDYLGSVVALAEDARTKRAAADIAARNTFKDAPIAGVGGAAWRTLFESAMQYAEHTAYPDTAYPDDQQHQHCVLCQQPLSSDALKRLTSFSAYLAEDVSSKAKAAEDALAAAKDTFANKAVRHQECAAVRAQIELIDAALARDLLRLFAIAKVRRRDCLAAVKCNGALPAIAWPAATQQKLAELISATSTAAAELEAAGTEEGRQRLEQERDELADRIGLTGWLDMARDELKRDQEHAILQRCIDQTDTRALTQLSNDIANKVVTPAIRDQFLTETKALGLNRINVEIVHAGGKVGVPQYQVRFVRNEKAAVGEVLSEGEQTCVSLAAFMTELATAGHKSALVFDDPVSSLDHRWRNAVAKRLVDEASVRQIIVFTHDYVFLNDLDDYARKAGITVTFNTLARTRDGTGVVSKGLPWEFKSVADRVDKLEQAARKARDLYQANDEEKYAKEARDIYDGLRATWERALEDHAYAQVIVRHRDYINTKRLRETTVLTESDVDAFEAGFEKCCDFVAAHDSSRVRNAALPTPDELLADIAAAMNWVKSIKDRQKVVRNS